MAVLQVNNIKKGFGSTDVLKGVSFSLEKGQVLTIIGSSGSGKTTLLRCLNFLESPDEGEILVNGKVLTSGNEEEIRNLLESELMPPDDMGYDFDNPRDGDDEPLSAEELTEELGKVLDTLFCEVFGNYRSVNIEVEL